MIVPFPETVQQQFTPEEIRLYLALGLFADNRVSLGCGAEIAGLSPSHFLHELGKRQIPIHYDVEDALQDIATAEQWGQ